MIDALMGEVTVKSEAQKETQFWSWRIGLFAPNGILSATKAKVARFKERIVELDKENSEMHKRVAI